MDGGLEARFVDDGIELDYPFPGASVHPSGLVPWSDVREVDPQATPPEVRTCDELFFVPGSHRDELARRAAAHAVPIVRRVDVWALILEPFLDTTTSADDEERTLDRLERAGVPWADAVGLRAHFAPAMVAYNFTSMLWAWAHLGSYDLLLALRGVLTGGSHRLGDADFAEVYRRVTAIALSAPPI